MSLHYNLENIHSYAFSECTSLRHVYFPSSVKNLNHAAFQHCTNLYSIDLKSSPLTIGYSVFDGCSNLNEVEVYEGTSIYTWGFPKKTIVKTLKKRLIHKHILFKYSFIIINHLIFLYIHVIINISSCLIASLFLTLNH